MKKIVIKKDRILMDNKELFPPISVAEVEEILGKAENSKIDDDKKIASVWSGLGIVGYSSDNLNTYDTFLVRVSDGEVPFRMINGVFNGEVYIENKLYTECKWKKEGYFEHILKKGCFEFTTFLINQIDEVPEEYKDIAIEISRMIEIDYIEPKVKSTKYKIEKTNEPVLKISDFNFKLAILQNLMYEKNLLLPKFDVYEFAKEYEKREIDIDEEGYEPIKEVVNWFKKVEIPISLASYIEEIVMDGGNEIYSQIIPFWDGEDDFFDIKDITEEDIKQFPNLKKITLLPSENNAKLIEKLTNYGIEADEL